MPPPLDAPHVVYAVDDLVVGPAAERECALWPVRRKERGRTQRDANSPRFCRPSPRLPTLPLLQGVIVDPRDAPEDVRRAEPPGDALCVLLFGPPTEKVGVESRAALVAPRKTCIAA